MPELVARLLVTAEELIAALNPQDLPLLSEAGPHSSTERHEPMNAHI